MEEQRNGEDGQRYLKRYPAQNSAVSNRPNRPKVGPRNRLQAFWTRRPCAHNPAMLQQQHGPAIEFDRRKERPTKQSNGKYVHTRGAECCRNQALRQISRQAR